MHEDVEVERSASRQEVATILRTLADGVARGSVAVEGEGGTIRAAVPEDLAYEVELESEAAEGDDDGVDVELEVELEWHAGSAGDVPAPAPAEHVEPEADDDPDRDADSGEVGDTVEAGEDEATPTDPEEDGGGGETGTASASQESADSSVPVTGAAPVESESIEELPVGAGTEAGSAARFELFTDGPTSGGGGWSTTTAT